MKPSQKQPGIIYLDRQKLGFFGSNITTNMISLDLPENIINDLEVIRADELSILIKAFIDFHKIIPSNVILVLSQDIYFEHTLSPSQEGLLGTEIENFLDNIPFENIGQKIYPSESQTKIIATNSNLYEEVKEAFEKQGFAVEAIIPEFVLGKYLPYKNNLSPEICRLIFEKFDSFKQESLLTKQTLPPSTHKPSKTSEMKVKENLKIIILISIFLCLLGVLGYMLIKTT